MCKIASSIFLLSVAITLLLLSAKFTYSLLFYNGNSHSCCCHNLGGPSENALTELNQSNELTSMNDAIGGEEPSQPSQDLAPAKGVRPSFYYLAPKDDKNAHQPNGFEPTQKPPMPLLSTMAPKSAILIPIATLIVHHSNSEPMGCQNNCCGNCCNCCGRRHLANRKCAKCHQNDEDEESKSAEMEDEEEDEEEYGSRKKYGKGEQTYSPSKNCEEIGEKVAEKCRWPCDGQNAREEEEDEFNGQNQNYSSNGQQRELQKVPLKLFRPFFARNANHGVFNSPPIEHKESFNSRPRSRSAMIDESFETLKERFSTRLGQLSSKLDLWKNLHRLQKSIDAQEKKLSNNSNISSNNSGMPTPISFRARSFISRVDLTKQQSDQNIRGRSLADNSILQNNKNMQEIASTTQSTLVETKIGTTTTIKPTTTVFGEEHELTTPPPPPITATMTTISHTTQWIRMAQSNNLAGEVPNLTRVEDSTTPTTSTSPSTSSSTFLSTDQQKSFLQNSTQSSSENPAQTTISSSTVQANQFGNLQHLVDTTAATIRYTEPFKIEDGPKGTNIANSSTVVVTSTSAAPFDSIMSTTDSGKISEMLPDTSTIPMNNNNPIETTKYIDPNINEQKSELIGLFSANFYNGTQETEKDVEEFKGKPETGKLLSTRHIKQMENFQPFLAAMAFNKAERNFAEEMILGLLLCSTALHICMKCIY